MNIPIETSYLPILIIVYMVYQNDKSRNMVLKFWNRFTDFIEKGDIR